MNTQSLESTGYLEIIIGPMFSGKTTRIVEIYNEHLKKNPEVKISVINFTGDTRYHVSMLSTHDQIMIPCIFTTKLQDIMNNIEVEESGVVLINEAQFFPDLYDVVVNMVTILNKRVYLCGLDGDFKRQRFGQVLDLIPMCDVVYKLKSVCHFCKKSAIFSYRLTNEDSQVVIGSSNYVPLCRKCYDLQN